MATTVINAFNEFAARLEPTEAQRGDASKKHAGVRDCLSGSLWVESAFLTGSYARRTIVRPPNDIDLCVVLDVAQHANAFFHAAGGAQSALNAFHRRLKTCYPDTPIRKDHPSVRLEFATIGFDVIPTFKRQGGGFFVPRHSGDGWMATDPTKHAEYTTNMNTATGGYFVPMVKMFKEWNYQHAKKLTGFHLEVALAASWPRVYSIVAPYSQPARYSSFAAAAAALLPAFAEQLRYACGDPAGLSGNIDSYLSNDDRGLTRTRLLVDAEEAGIALRHDAASRTEAAITKWRRIFGDWFPAYG